jgi:hypothetical protein
MAKVYADQGHFKKAAEIYRYLLDKEPENLVLKDALSEMEAVLEKESQQEKKNLVPLFREWITLSLKYNNMKKLRKLGKP